MYYELTEVLPASDLVPLHLISDLFSHWSYTRSKPEDVPTFDGKLAVVVNSRSLPWVEAAALALKNKGRVKLVFDPQGVASGYWGGVPVLLGANQYKAGSRSTKLEPDAVVPAGQDATAVALRLLSGTAVRGPARTRTSMKKGPASNGSALSRAQRVAALLKAWFVLKEFSPHLDLADIDFDRDLPSWIKKVEKADDRRSFIRTLCALGAQMNDSQVGLWNNLSEVFGTHWPPVTVGRLERRTVATSIHQDHRHLDVKRGDDVTHVDGRPVAEVAAETATLISASTSGALDRNLYAWILGGKEDSKLTLTIKRGSKHRDLHLIRSLPANATWEPATPPPPATRKLDSGLGYIHLGRVETSSEFDRALRKLRLTPGLILDMRGYPKFAVQWDVVSRLINEPILGTQFHEPLRRAGHPKHSFELVQLEISPYPKLKYLAPVVVLINALAGSASEDFCIYLRNANRATFVGSQTTGTNGNITRISLTDDISLTFTGMKVMFGDGSPFQNIGIIPDVESYPTIKGWLAGKDEVLEAGENLLLKQIEKDAIAEKAGIKGRPSGT